MQMRPGWIVPHELVTSHGNISLFIKIHNYEQFTYQLILVYMAHEEIIWEIVKNYVTSHSNLEVNKWYDLTSKFGQRHRI